MRVLFIAGYGYRYVPRESRPRFGPNPGTGAGAELSHPDEHASRPLTGRLRDGRRVQRDLATVPIFSDRGKLAIGLVVDHGPRAVLLEGEVDDPLHHHTAAVQAGDRCFAPARPAAAGVSCSREQIVRQHALHRVRGGDQFVCRRGQNATVNLGDSINGRAICLEWNGGEHGMHQLPES